ncbi:hypothetical protein [Bacillus atrophaeus]|nr:hypothetical protein [Bacillus atrophaeus]
MMCLMRSQAPAIMQPPTKKACSHKKAAPAMRELLLPIITALEQP